MFYLPPNPSSPSPKPELAGIIQELRNAQRSRSQILKSRIMFANRLRGIIGASLGYDPNAPESDRKKIEKEALRIIKEARKSDQIDDIVLASHIKPIIELEKTEQGIIDGMVEFAERLPVAKWVQLPEQRGFGMPSLATIIGECGDLGNYANPGKFWARMGCAPFTFDGKTAMGGTWKSGKEGKLTAEAWTEYGYSPRRRSLAYVIGENLLKLNGNISGKGDGEDDSSSEHDTGYVGPYRRRYNEAKASIAESHPDYSKQRCHRHGMLLATKLLLKNLWIEWNR